MIVLHTPDQQNEELETFYSTVFRLNGLGIPRNLYRTDNGLALNTGWCRECVIGTMADVFQNAPPGKINIYGIRKHGTSATYQPSSCPGKIRANSSYTNNLFTSFFTMMVELLACVLNDKRMSDRRVQQWYDRFNHGSFDTSYRLLGEQPISGVDCILNVDEEDIPDLGDSGFWANGNTFGTITNIPAHWAECIPVMSYLLYIPRLWGAFYSTPRALPKLSQISRYRYPLSKTLNTLLGSTRPYPKYAQLWLGAVKNMMLPLWLTSCGKENFWTFTYLLMVCALAKEHHPITIPPNIKEQLATTNIGGGFKSWGRWYSMQEGTPDWLQTMRKELHTNGPFSLLYTNNITQYI